MLHVPRVKTSSVTRVGILHFLDRNVLPRAEDAPQPLHLRGNKKKHILVSARYMQGTRKSPRGVGVSGLAFYVFLFNIKTGLLGEVYIYSSSCEKSLTYCTVAGVYEYYGGDVQQ